jgi:hypothetical protein
MVATVMRAARGEAQLFLRKALDYAGDECLIWPFSKLKAGAQINWKGQPRLAARVLCELVHGPPPTPKHESAHSCGKGHLGCIAPRHVRWATHAENVKDMFIHDTTVRGTKNGQSKLRPDEVLAIRKMRGRLSQRKIREKFGVNQSTIWRIQNGQRWSWFQTTNR